MKNFVRVRFAPSPTGPLHLGGIRTALYNYLFAKKHKGTFILRIEDTDRERFIHNSVSYILESLKWCGIIPDEGVGFGDGPYAPYYQSKRGKIYIFYLNKLLQSGHAYYAFDTFEDLNKKRNEYKNMGKTFSYNHRTRMFLNNSLTMTKKQLHIKFKNNLPYVIRFKVTPGKMLKIHDIIRGPLEMNTEHLDDKILLKSNGGATYHLANTVDDYLMKITHVIRGEEWISSMFLHVLLYKSFGWDIPYFVHLPLILKNNGKGKISKREINYNKIPLFPIQWKDPNTNTFIPGYRELGYFPEAFVNMLALLGWNPGGKKEIFSLKELENFFSLERIKKSGVFFNIEKLIWFNKQYVKKNKKIIFNLLCKELKKRSIVCKQDYLNKVIDITIDRIHFVHEIWEKSFYFFTSPKRYEYEEIDFSNYKTKIDIVSKLENTCNLLCRVNPFTYEYLKESFKTIKKRHKIMQLVRLALVGEGKGVDICIILYMIGKDKSVKRINKFINIMNNKIFP
ncbi:glutamate--tRNA ligase [Blattabacterium cuenoti]|uniref:glutamate--tRNA ligase n=1 Tax=Blattabacterium cuenoti TaxID=1653831 RepID=UPI00163C3417|nr:glutamate--tRNA ligase [Blattabacterium cuenoti]